MANDTKGKAAKGPANEQERRSKAEAEYAAKGYGKTDLMKPQMGYAQAVRLRDTGALRRSALSERGWVVPNDQPPIKGQA